MPTSGNMINILRMGGFSPWLSGLLDHGTPGTTKSVRFLESTEDPGINGYVIFLNAPNPYMFIPLPETPP
ncbi:hypothetical protein OUZ56_012829 [Daphnia magna]|uniref:Uncharacterized protein n=1 Tax=Daphnia magna TaxID=35525 RepID=A0ABQ9Z471_9CRUS|nr:hypothetical protein OUZ56_012829 [Daphnia magna]